jgi:hypothetical protein
MSEKQKIVTGFRTILEGFEMRIGASIRDQKDLGNVIELAGRCAEGNIAMVLIGGLLSPPQYAAPEVVAGIIATELLCIAAVAAFKNAPDPSALVSDPETIHAPIRARNREADALASYVLGDPMPLKSCLWSNSGKSILEEIAAYPEVATSTREILANLALTTKIPTGEK